MSVTTALRPTTTTLISATLVGLALFPELALAGDKVWTVYAYGSGNVLRQIFEGMKGFVEDEGYKQMIFVLLLLMMIFTLIKGFIFNRPSPVPIVGLIMAAFILNIALFSRASRADIHIEDQVHGEDYLVEDVPLVLAGASALTSEMSRYMVKLVEAFYMGPSIPQELMMSNNNTYNFTNKVMSALKNVNLSEPHTKATFNSYMRECVVPEMYQGRIRLDGLLNAEPQDFWNSINVSNQARMSVCFQPCTANADPDTACPIAECPNPYGTGSASGTTITAREWRGGMMVACDDGHTKLGERITTLIGASAFNQLGNTLLRDSSILDGVISSSVTHITGLTGSSGTEHFVRAGMMNMFRESSASVIANGGGEGLIQVIGVNQAKATQRTNWMVAAEVFAESVSYLWSALQAFIYAIFPIAIVLFFFPGVGLKAMGSYFGLLAWISLWMPFLAIINFLSLAWLAEDIRQLAMVPMSYGSLVPISEAGSNMQAITNFLGTMVPVLTYGMVKGGEFALTQIATEASAPKASEKGAAEIAGKSYSYGSISANNFGANKFDGTTSMSMGYDAVSNKEGAGVLTNLQPRDMATSSAAGSPDVVSGSGSVGTEQSKAGGFQLAAGNSVKFGLQGTQQTLASLSNGIDMTAQGTEANSSMKSMSAELRKNSQQTEADAAMLAQNAATAFKASTKVDSRGGFDASGAFVDGLIAGNLAANGVDSYSGATVDSYKKRLEEIGGGSVAAGLKKQAAEAGLAFNGDDKDAEMAIQSVAQKSDALKSSNPGIGAGDVATGVIAMGLAERTTPEEMKQMKEEGGGFMSKGLADFAEKYQNELNLGAVVGTGTVAGGVVAAGSLFARVADKVKGGVLSDFAAVKGKTSITGSASEDVDSSTGTQGAQSTTSTNAYGVGFYTADQLTNSSQSTQAASEAVKTGLTRIASDAQGRIQTREENGAITFSNSETVTDKSGAGVDARFNEGTLDAMKRGGAYAEVLRAAQNPEATQAALRGRADEFKAKADAAYENADRKSSGAGGPVQMPTAPGLESGDMGAARAAQGAALGVTGGPQLGTPAAVASKSGPAGGGDVLANRAMASDAQRGNQFANANQNQIDALVTSAGNASSYAIPLTGGVGRIGGAQESVDAGFQSSLAAVAGINDGRATAGAMDLAGFDTIRTERMMSRAGFVNAVRDTETGAAFTMVANENSNERIVLNKDRNEAFGEFLSKPQAVLIGVNPNDYEGLSPRDAVEKYNNSDAGARNAAAETKYSPRGS